MDHLKRMLDTINVTYTEKTFESEEDIAGLGPQPFVSDYRILKLLQSFIKVGYIYHLTHRIPASEYTSLQLMLCMQDCCCVR